MTPTQLRTLTNEELVRIAEHDPLMQCPLFAEALARIHTWPDADEREQAVGSITEALEEVYDDPVREGPADPAVLRETAEALVGELGIVPFRQDPILWDAYV